MDVETIRAKIRAGKYIISFTHTEKVRLRKIEAEEIEQAICNGAIIEPYPDDPRGASCLVLGFTSRDRPLHVICGRLGLENEKEGGYGCLIDVTFARPG
jgi:hypothetical protein